MDAAQPPAHLCLGIANEIGDLPSGLDAIDHFLKAWRVAAADHAQVMTIADEIAANIIRNAWPAGGTHRFTLELSVEPVASGLRLALLATDNGVPFDPTAAPDPDLDLPIDEREPGGLGLFMVREMSDTLHYERCDGRNALRLTKRLHQAAEG